MAKNKNRPQKVKEKTAAIRNKIKDAEKKVAAKASAKIEKPLNRSKLLVSIVNQKDDLKLKEVLDEISVSLSFTFAGKGTARSTVLDYLGIGETEKVIVVSVIPESDEDKIIRKIRQEMALYLVGRGISFTIPLSGISEIVAKGIAAAASNKNMDRSKIMKSEDRKYDLIVVSVEANHVDEAIEAAREAGAAGGTVIRARNLNNAKAEQFVGISLLEEREILIILTKKEGKLAIMQALSEKVGLKTEAGGVIFSLPVDRTAGISAADEEEIEKKEEQEEKEQPQETAVEPKEVDAEKHE
ncbi:MAG: hypothetical protein K2G44_00235 [Clostridia bacterium]|nr:hypothetical protein [Clostridia bacterium]